MGYQLEILLLQKVRVLALMSQKSNVSKQSSYMCVHLQFTKCFWKLLHLSQRTTYNGGGRGLRTQDLDFRIWGGTPLSPGLA